MKKKYVVPTDFSRDSGLALDYARRLARKDKGMLLLVHVIPATVVYPTELPFTDYLGALEKEAAQKAKRMAKQKKLSPKEYRFMILRQNDAARAIADTAGKRRASMIVMGSHGRTGLERAILGSVAERTLRYARCPVLIVKK